MRALRLSVLLLLAAGCGDFLPPDEPMGTGRACTTDSECVPDGCCGEATSAIHVMDAPSCSGQMCTGQCPEAQVRCGCGLPVCRDAHCTVAVATDPQCG